MATELNWPAGCNKATLLHESFIGHARQRHDLIGCSEIRTVGAQSVLNVRSGAAVQSVCELQFMGCEQALKVSDRTTPHSNEDGRRRGTWVWTTVPQSFRLA